ncbi:MAG: 2-C-methyl-D-erythritol 4-phosphate cytidylyltransferase, partial [Alistipes sp.]|nr:2-C-methyl-D-erythritol 4-phosphate cytidylyltransferase [Alistipes sp.]
DSGEILTDDCAAVERLGKEVYLEVGSYENIKITTPEDIALTNNFSHNS